MKQAHARSGQWVAATALAALLTLSCAAQSAPAPAASAPPAVQHPHRMAAPRTARPMQEPAGTMQQSAPIERRTPQNTQPMPQASAGGNPQGNLQFKGNKDEHLSEWMRAHSNLSPAQQQDALRNEPGFRELPPQTQQRFLEQLGKLNAMTPDQRVRMQQHIELMEKLTPEQRAEVRSATLQWGALPPDEKKTVGKAFRDLRGLPPEQRLPILNQRYRGLSPQGRQALMQLMQVEPMLPPDHF